MIDVSSGGNAADQKIVLGPGYQVPFAAAIRRDVGIPVIAVGLITEPVQAEHILSTGQADAVCLARALAARPLLAASRRQGPRRGDALAQPVQALRHRPPGPLAIGTVLQNRSIPQSARIVPKFLNRPVL